jgi:alkylation response protein AidB-like acyl-CoA dehydrogenase
MFPSPYMSTIVLGGMTVLESGNDEQKSEILPEIIDGQEIIVFALGKSEPNLERTKLKPDRITITATADGEDYVLEGVERFIHHATIATTFLVPAITGNSNSPEENITLFLVDTESPGVTVTRLATIQADNQCEVILDKVRVPGKSILGRLNGGWAPLSRSLQIEAVMLASQMLGAGEHMLQASQEDYDTRLESGIDDDIKQYNEDYLANLRRDIDNCRLITYQAADKLAGGESIDFEAAIVKGWTDYAQQHA